MVRFSEFKDCAVFEKFEDVWLTGVQKWRSELFKFDGEGSDESEWLIEGGTKKPPFM